LSVLDFTVGAEDPVISVHLNPASRRAGELCSRHVSIPLRTERSWSTEKTVEIKIISAVLPLAFFHSNDSRRQMNHLVRGERVRGINAIGYYVESIPASNVGIVGPFHSKPISAGMLNFEDFPYDVGVNSDICLTELLQPQDGLYGPTPTRRSFSSSSCNWR
jgi:hypothetical protein